MRAGPVLGFVGKREQVRVGIVALADQLRNGLAERCQNAHTREAEVQIMTTVWLVAILSLTLPSEYQLRSNNTDSFPVPGPPGMRTSEEFRSWVAPGGRTLYFFYWTPYPRDLGPMAIVSESPARVAGQDTKIIETSLFMGTKQRVLVAHLGFKDQKASAMIYAAGVDRGEFESILAGIRRVEKK
jgi:hypothetical protein